MSNYKALAAKISKCQSLGDTERVARSLDRVYNAGQLTVSEYQRLDAKLLDKTIAIEDHLHFINSGSGIDESHHNY